MKLRLGLSAEEITDPMTDVFDGVGLLRGEYLCRKIGMYIPLEPCRDFIRGYLRRVCRLFAPHPVWYRTTELETAEVNVLQGADEIIEEKTTMLGYRGVRRGMRHRETFLLELAAIAEVAAEHDNLQLMIPFVSEVEEFVFTRDALRGMGFRNQIGMMAEIPAAVLCLEEFLEAGAQCITLGMNDLSSLTTGGQRNAELRVTHRGVRKMVEMARTKTRAAGVPLQMAGYLNPALLEMARESECDYAVLHYSKLGEVLGERYANLPHQEDLNAIKRKTRDQVYEREERVVLARAQARAAGRQ